MTTKPAATSPTTTVGARCDGAVMDLSDIDHQTLQLEQSWWKYAGAKESKIREVFGESSTRYYQRLNALINTPEAEAAYPLLVRRLRRLRDERRGARSAARREMR